MLAAALLAGICLGSLTGGPGEAAGADGQTVALALGDTATVDGLPVGCRVVRRGAPAARMLDCRRAGALRGTYGVFIGRWNVRVVHFQSNTVARLVFSGRHRGGTE